MASAGCRKNAGVPVLARVAAILRQMMPDLPIPVRMTRPLQVLRSSTAQENRASMRPTSARIAAASVSRTLRAKFRSAMDGDRLTRDFVDGDEPAEQRLEPVERERALRVALRARRVFVHFQEHAVDARRDTRLRERFDVLGEAGRDA